MSSKNIQNENLTNRFIKFAKPITDRCSKISKNSNWKDRYVVTRLGNLAVGVPKTIITVADTVLGIAGSGVALATLGFNSGINQTAWNHLRTSKRLILTPYLTLLRTINPNTGIGSETMKKSGLISHYVRTSLRALAQNCYKSENLLKKHVASRLTYALMGIVSIITRLADGIIGSIAAIFALLTLGMIKPLNRIACRGLQFPALINDLFYSTIKVLHPSQEFSLETRN
jgi:hypothetical protein